MLFNVLKNKSTTGGILCQVCMTIVINIPLVSFGMTMGWLSPNSLVLQSTSGPTAEVLSDEEVSWMASVTFLVAIPAVFLYWAAADILGRKFALVCTSVPFLICWSLKLYSSEAWALITARAIAGLGSSGCFIVPPLYVKEIAQDSVRGALGSVLVLAQNAGYLLVYIMSDYMEYRGVLWACLAVPLLHVALVMFLPESPSFMISRGRIEEATTTLAWLRQRDPHDKRISEELDNLREREHTFKVSKKQLFKSIVADKATFRAFRISLTVVLAQEVCGLFTLVMYAGRIFETAGRVGLTSNQQVMLLGVVQLAGSLVASSFVERTGRKPLLATSGYIVSVCMLSLGAWFYLNTMDVALPSWLPATAMCVAILCDSAGLQPVPYVIMSEMFKFELRGMVTTVVIGFTDLANFAELKVFHPIINSMGMHTCFFIFAFISFCFSTYVVMCVPETMGKSIDDILEGLRRDKKVNGAVAIKHDVIVKHKDLNDNNSDSRTIRHSTDNKTPKLDFSETDSGIMVIDEKINTAEDRNNIVFNDSTVRGNIYENNSGSDDIVIEKPHSIKHDNLKAKPGTKLKFNKAGTEPSEILSNNVNNMKHEMPNKRNIDDNDTISNIEINEAKKEIKNCTLFQNESECSRL